MDRVSERLREGAPPLTMGELADMLNCSRRYVQKLIEAGNLNAGRVGRDYRIPVQEAARLAREARVLTT